MMWGAVFLLSLVGTAIADPRFAFPEDMRPSGSRIVSGSEARVGQFPHQLGLRMVSPAGAVFGCGGSILTPEWGMTAAHCTAGRVTIVIRAGTTNQTLPAVIFETTKYYNHPAYNEAIPGIVQPNDIGLLEFGRSLTFGELIQPIRLQRSSDKNRDYSYVQAIASGWGNTWTQGTSPEVLNWVFLRLIANQECWIAYGGSSIIADSTICTRGWSSPTESTCQGDSGGPLTIIDDDGGLTQVGVTSFVSGLGCHAGVPSGFIRPGHYLEWFADVTGVNFDWEYEQATDAPEDDATNTPEDEATDAPEDDTTDGPEDNVTDATGGPEEDATNAPEDDSTDAPEDDATDAPEGDATEAPEVDETDVPEGDESDSSEDSSPSSESNESSFSSSESSD